MMPRPTGGEYLTTLNAAINQHKLSTFFIGRRFCFINTAALREDTNLRPKPVSIWQSVGVRDVLLQEQAAGANQIAWAKLTIAMATQTGSPFQLALSTDIQEQGQAYLHSTPALDYCIPHIEFDVGNQMLVITTYEESKRQIHCWTWVPQQS